MMQIVISTASWSDCFEHANQQSCGTTPYYRAEKIKQFLADQYGIVDWHRMTDAYKFQITFVDDKKIPWFLLRWT